MWQPQEQLPWTSSALQPQTHDNTRRRHLDTASWWWEEADSKQHQYRTVEWSVLQPWTTWGHRPWLHSATSYIHQHTTYPALDLHTQAVDFVLDNYHSLRQLIIISLQQILSKHGVSPSSATDAKIWTAFPLENWRRPLGCPRTTWMKTIQQDLKSNNLSLNEAIDVAQNRPHWRLMSTFGARHS